VTFNNELLKFNFPQAIENQYFFKQLTNINILTLRDLPHLKKMFFLGAFVT